ncbi:tetratricopeptide repeat protein [Spirosoma radiotolerans]|uniref:Tetratricopeptide repeat protein n=1 Tax=Spirosoma radiotolerans TaxID=1379870 RepID=A0A0E3V4T0_9BACT|nr:tetratricopeptide repeat protein [Spirosoma radiotolerans]AKD53587.1 hypothetical protein SD10_00395 [Spirosoma radiotolerans]
MKTALFLCLLLRMAAFAQPAEQFLKSSASMLAINRNPELVFFGATSRQKSHLDTLSASAQNYRSHSFYHLWRQNYEEATLWLEKTGNSYPKENGMIGEVYLRSLKDYPRALQHLDAYDALTPNFDDMISHNPVSYLRGLAYRGLNNHPKAIEQFCIAIDSLARKHGAEWVNYKHFVSRAVSYMAIGQADKALTDLAQATKNFNRSALVAYHKGRALLQLGRTAEARTAFQDASFFVKALRAERTGDYQEDDFNPIYEEEIDEAISQLKTKP